MKSIFYIFCLFSSLACAPPIPKSDHGMQVIGESPVKNDIKITENTKEVLESDRKHCFAYTKKVHDHFENIIDVALNVALAKWSLNWEVRHNNCDNILGMRELNDEFGEPIDVLAIGGPTDDGDGYIILNEHFVNDFVGTLKECTNEQYLLSTILAHEIGHVLGFDHIEKEEELMSEYLTSCSDLDAQESMIKQVPEKTKNW